MVRMGVARLGYWHTGNSPGSRAENAPLTYCLSSRLSVPLFSVQVCENGCNQNVPTQEEAPMKSARLTRRARHCRCTRAKRFFGESIIAVNPDCPTHGPRKASHRRLNVITWLGALRHSVSGIMMLSILAFLVFGAIVVFYEGIVALIKFVF